MRGMVIPFGLKYDDGEYTDGSSSELGEKEQAGLEGPACGLSKVWGDLFQVLGHQLGHIKHGDRFFPTEDRGKLLIRINHPTID